MKIEYRIRYVPVYGPPEPAPASMSAMISSARATLRAGSKKDQERLSEILQALSRVASISNSMGNSGIAGMLSELMGQALAKARAGDLSGAMEIANALVPLAEKCAELLHRTRANINKIASMTGLAGGAGGAAGAFADAARAALKGANSLGELEALAGTVEQALGLFQSVQHLDPSSPQHAALMGKIGGATNDIVKTAPLPESRMGRDGVAWSQETGQRVRDSIQQLRSKARDAVAEKTLDKFDQAMAGLLQAAKPQGPKAQEALREQINTLLKRAALSDVAGASAEAEALSAKWAQGEKMHGTLTRRRDQLAAQIESLEGPARKRAEAVLAKLDAALQAAVMPEELFKLDALMQTAFEATGELASGKGKPVLKDPAFKRLVNLERSLKSMSEAPVSPWKLDDLVLQTQTEAPSNAARPIQPPTPPVAPGEQAPTKP
ncbi:MAG: hypothetical protein VKP62_15540 [Candidatus Sericytochromatia bacterium]|nr:hypothetical protein [Candidatus Sericytochromatia bacterium]